jgi:hypothetical protein
MSKMDGLRAMREARHAEATKRAARAKPALTLVEPPVAPPAGGASAPAPSGRRPEAVAELPAPELCGHRAISGRTCTRELGHAAKSHRYS